MKRTILSVVACAMLMTLTSCGGGGCSVTGIASAIAKISTASTEWSNDPSDENCKAYAKALEDYIDEFDGCPGVTDEEIREYRKSIDDLNCN